MTFAPFAEVTDVTEVWGPLTPDEEAKVPAWINQASIDLRVIARNRGVNLDALLAGDPLAKEVAKNAVVRAVTRVLMNPEGWRQKAITTGPFGESGTLDTAISSGLVYIADGDIAGLFPQKKKRMQSFRVRSGYRQ